MPQASPLGRLGAPGIRVRAPEPVRTLVGVRRDVAAFLGVAPRGPAGLPPETLEDDVAVAPWLETEPRRRSVAVPVSSWDEYRRVFGGYEGPGRLPYAVSAFFAGGGRLAYVVRIVPVDPPGADPDEGRARGTLGALTTATATPITILARDEGRWGNALRATLHFDTRPLALREATGAELVVGRREWVPQGSLLRLRLPGGISVLRHVDTSAERADPTGGGVSRVLTLAGGAGGAPERAEVVTGRLETVDHDPTHPRREELSGLGLRADHPRWLARVLVRDSALLWPEAAWSGGEVALSDSRLPPVTARALDTVGGATRVVPHLAGGRDRWHEVVPDDFFDPAWLPGDEVPRDGVHCLVERDDVGLLLAPDLYDPLPLEDLDDVTDPPTLCGPDFAVHVESPPATPAPVAVPGLAGLRLDPRVPAELDEVVRAQRRMVDHAAQRRDLTVLLDAPLGLPQRQVLEWRNQFDSAHAAAYHPWLDVAAPDDGRDSLVRVNPSAFAAAIIAERELRLGVHHGPANEVAVGAVRVADDVLPGHHDALHEEGIDVFVAERGGIRLTGARTLSRRPPLRQLSVARLMTVLRLTLQREMRWAVFEPSNPSLWAEVRRLVHDLLSALHEAGAFRGATTKEAFFVRCDRTTMTRNDLDRGRLVCLVGVAPAEPLEHLVIEVALTSDEVRVEVAG